MDLGKSLLTDDFEDERNSSFQMDGYFTPRGRPQREDTDKPHGRFRGGTMDSVFSDDERHHSLSGGDSGGDDHESEEEHGGVKYRSYEVRSHWCCRLSTHPVTPAVVETTGRSEGEGDQWAVEHDRWILLCGEPPRFCPTPLSALPPPHHLPSSFPGRCCALAL